MSDESKRPGRRKGSKNVQHKGDVIKIRDLDTTNPITAYLDDVKETQGLKTRSSAGQLVLDYARQRRLFLPDGIDASLVLGEPQL